MSAKLYLHFPQSNLPAYEISSDQEIIVGRAPSCEVDLVRYLGSGPLEIISREHFKLFYRKNEGFLIIDISYNGTQVNNDYLTKGKPRILRDGDIIKLAKEESFIIKVGIDDDPNITATVEDPVLTFAPAKNQTGSGLYFDQTTSQFVVNGEPVPHEQLTKLEVTLLTYLYHNAGRLCSFDEIAAQVWNDPGWAPGNNTISRAVGNLRRKLDQISPGAEEYIQNVRGQGYKVTIIGHPQAK